MKSSTICLDENKMTSPTNELTPLPLDVEKFKQNFKNNNQSNLEKENGTMPRALCDKVIQEVKKLKEWTSTEDTFAMITGLVQIGGSNKVEKSKKNVTFEMGKMKLASSELLECINKATTETRKKNTYTIRQFCRTMANEIAEFASVMSLEGDLTQKMRLDISDLSLEDAIWCSNFQTRNPNCPEKVKQWLVSNYKQHFRT